VTAIDGPRGDASIGVREAAVAAAGPEVTAAGYSGDLVCSLSSSSSCRNDMMITVAQYKNTTGSLTMTQTTAPLVLATAAVHCLAMQ